MKFRLILFLFFIVVSNTLFAQDIIIKQAGDSIQCYITKVKRDSIYYKYWNLEKIEDEVLALNQVKRFEYYFYEHYKTIVEEKTDSSKVKVDISFGVGLSFRLGKMDPSISKENEADYRNGFNFTGRAGIIISDVFGFGIKYNQHGTKAGVVGFQSIVKIKYFGPYLLLQTKPINNIMVFSGLFGVGKLSYNEKLVESLSFLSNTYEYNGSTTGINIGGSYNLILSQHLNFSLDVNIITGKIDDGELVDKNGNITTNLPEESASTFNFGFSFHLLL